MIIGTSSAEDAENRLVLLPFILDGDGVRSRLLVTNVSEASSQCSIDIAGSDLDTARFEDHFLVSTEGARATFELEEDGGNLTWTSRGEQSLTYGYASLDCVEPVSAQVLYSSSVAGEFVSLTSMPGARKADRFQFTLMPQVGSLVLVFANDLAPDASCGLELESPYGSVLSRASISIPAMTSVFQMANELFRIPEDYTVGAVRVICDRELGATGFLLNGGKFSVLPPVVLSAPLISISSGAAVSEGGDAVFTISANAWSFEDLTLSLTVGVSGSHVNAGELGGKRVILPAGRTSVDYIVATTDDSDNEDDGAVTATINPGEGYLVSETEDLAQVAISDNDKPAPVIEPVEPEREPGPEPEPVPQPRPQPQPQPNPQPQPDSDPDSATNPTPDPQRSSTKSVFNGWSIELSRASGRSVTIRWELDPEGFNFPGFTAYVEPYNAGTFCCGDLYYRIMRFTCRGKYSGNAEIRLEAWVDHVKHVASANFTCE